MDDPVNDTVATEYFLSKLCGEKAPKEKQPSSRIKGWENKGDENQSAGATGLSSIGVELAELIFIIMKHLICQNSIVCCHHHVREMHACVLQ